MDEPFPYVLARVWPSGNWEAIGLRQDPDHQEPASGPLDFHIGVGGGRFIGEWHEDKLQEAVVERVQGSKWVSGDTQVVVRIIKEVPCDWCHPDNPWREEYRPGCCPECSPAAWREANKDKPLVRKP